MLAFSRVWGHMSTPNLLCGGRFQLTRQLGEGGMAIVHQAFDHRLQVWRAIKTLNPTYATKKKLRQRFLGEAQAMARLEHKNIVRVYDVGEDGPTVYIVMELVDGGALEDYLEKHGQMPPRLAVRCLLDVCAGIEAAHEQGIIHRDIKPHNVLVDRNGVCKVTDFGIAQIKDTSGQMTRTGTVMGTLGFMAPEQRTDSKHVDERSDVYSLGASLFTMVTSRTSMDLFASEQDDTILADVGAQLKGIIGKATRYHPDKRYADVGEFADALRELLPHLPPDPPSTPELVRQAISMPEPPALPDEVDTSTFSTELGDEPMPPATQPAAHGGQQQVVAEAPVTAQSRIRAGFEDEMPTSLDHTIDRSFGRSQSDIEEEIGEKELSKRLWEAFLRALRTIVDYAVGEGFLFRFLLPASIIVLGIGVWLNLGREAVKIAQSDFEHARSDYVAFVLTDADDLGRQMLAAGVKQGVVEYHLESIERAKRATTLEEQLEAANKFVEAADGALASPGITDIDTQMKIKKARAKAKIMTDKRQFMLEAHEAWMEISQGPAASTAISLRLAEGPPG
ncbi:MAG: serine/threonine protein kinase [Deltaproteobacteria bacterium]|nr:MAG: serine/threonine protein kinase [Deltaproteobacteria bacterium]